jgi:hypothetical protein
MPLNVPEANSRTFLKVMNALGGEDYAYYSFDVKNVEAPDSTKKVQIALKVFVPQNKRLVATEQIADALRNDGVDVLSKEKMMDVIIPNSDGKKVIRIEVKPPSGGSGAGADVTKIVESAQCVYAAMQYECGDLDVITEKDYACGAKFCDTPGVKLEDIMSLPKEWKQSSLVGAKKIKQVIGGRAGEYMFVRGDAIIEEAISKAFGRVKKQTNLSSEDKWNPADIWMLRKSMKNKIAEKLKTEGTIDCLNNYLQELNASKDMIGFSLKKIGGTPTLKLINGDTPTERKKKESANFAKYSLTFDNGRAGDKRYPMDLYIHYGANTFEKFQARNFGGDSKGDWKLELKGQFAAQGKIQGKVVYNLLTNAGFSGLPSEAVWTNCSLKAPESTKKSVTDEIYKLLQKHNAQGFQANNNTKSLINTLPQSWRFSKLCGLRFLDWMMGLPKAKRDQAVKEIYLYASSQSDKSSVYYKLS